MSAVVVNGSVLTGYLPARARRPAPMRAAASLLALCLSLGLVEQVAATSVPGPVVNLDAQAGAGQVTLFWDAPSDGGAAITDYVVTYDDGSGAMTFDDGTIISLSAVIRTVVTGLTNGQSYTFTVAAVNTFGTSETVAIDATPSLTASDTIEPRSAFFALFVYRFGNDNIDPKYASVGRTVHLIFDVTEELASVPSVTIAGQVATVYPTPFNPPVLYPADPDYIPDLTFRKKYTAQIIVTSSPLQGPATYDIGILTDVAGNTFDPAPATTDDLIIDTVAPTVVSVTSTTSDGSYQAGDEINITVTTSEAGRNERISITLETGTTDRNVTLTRAADDPEFVGTYRVQAIDTSARLTAISIAATPRLTDRAGNRMTDFTIPPGQNFAANNIVIGTLAPAITTAATHSVAEGTTAVATFRAVDATTAAEDIRWSKAGGDDETLFEIDAMTGALAFITAPDFEAMASNDNDNDYQVTIRATDDDASPNSINLIVTVTVTNVNEPGIAAVTVVRDGRPGVPLDDAPREHDVLTITLTDPEGVNSIEWFWIRVSEANRQFVINADVDTPTTTTYTVARGDVGKTLLVLARYNDGLQNNGIEVTTAVVAANIPAAVTGLEAQVGRNIMLSWDAPDNGGAAITDYVITYDDGGGATAFDDGTGTGTAATVTGLTNAQSYTFTVAARNSVGTGAAATITATPQSSDATLSSLVIAGGTLTPTFDPATLEYDTLVMSGTESVMVTPTANDSAAMVMVNEAPVTSGTASNAITLDGHINTITIRVTIRTTTATYTVRVTRGSPPTADAGADQSGVAEGSTVTLSGSGTDPEDDMDPDKSLSYLWEYTMNRVGQPPRIITAADTPTATFTAPHVAYNVMMVFRLTVTDSDGATATDTITVSVPNVVRPRTIASVTLREGEPRQTAVVAYWLLGPSIDQDPLTGYDVQYRLASAADLNAAYTVVPHTGISKTATITGLTMDTAYVVRVRTRTRPSSVTSAWVAATIMTQPPNVSPTAAAGNDPGGATEGRPLTLSGSGTDPEDDMEPARPLRYLWEHTLTDSSAPATPLTITAADTAMPTFTVPYVTADTSLTFQLRVTDRDDASTTDTVTVSITNVVQLCAVASVTLNAGSSPLTEVAASWTQGEATDKDPTTGFDVQYRLASAADRDDSYTAVPHTGTGTTATITGLASATAYVVRVRTRSGSAVSDWETAMTATANAPPTAAAGADPGGATEGSPLTLSGSGTDPDAKPLRYLWEHIMTDSSAPATPLTITAADTAMPTFTVPYVTADTSLTFQLRVTDSEGVSATDTVTVSITNVVQLCAVASVTLNAGSSPLTEVAASWTQGEATDKDPTTGFDVQYRLASAADLDDSYTAVPHTGTGTTATITGLASATAYVVRVRTRSGSAVSDWETAMIATANAPPTAAAGADPGGAVEGSPLTLSGSGTDPEDDMEPAKPLRYLWEHIMTDSSAPAIPLTITAADTTMPSFTVPYVTADTSLTFQLRVTDSEGASATDTVTVSITNMVQPRAIASLSNGYPKHDIIFVEWTQGEATDNDPTTGFDVQYRLASAADRDDSYTAVPHEVNPLHIGPEAKAAAITRLTAATAYVVRVRAVSGTVPGDWSEVSITTAAAPPNTPPLADAGYKQPAVVGEALLPGALVTLDGSRSSTATGTITGYAWTQFGCPVGGTTHGRIMPGADGCPAVTLTDANTARPTFTVPDIDARTDFIFALDVTASGGLMSIPDLVTITAAPADALFISLLTMPTFGGTPVDFHAPGTPIDPGTLAFRYLRAGDSITVTVRSNRPLKADTLAGSATFSVAGAIGIDLVAGDTATAYSVSYDIAAGDNTGPEALSLRISGVEDENGITAADTSFKITRTRVDAIPPTLSIMQHADNDYVLIITPSGHSGSFSADDLLYNGEYFGNTWSTTRADSIFCLLGSSGTDVILATDCRSPAAADVTVTNRFQVGDTFSVRENVIRDLAENGNAMVSFNVPTVPRVPADLRASGGNGQVTLVWNVPADGGNAISGYQYRQATSSAALATTTTWTATGSTDPVYTVTGLTNGTPYFFQVRAVNIKGESDASAEATATPSTILSTDASLYDLTISADPLTFVPGTTAYDVQVENSVASVTVTPTVTHSAATIAVMSVSVTSGTASGAIGLGVGDTTITIVVTAEDGTTMQTYTIIVTRAVLPFNDATLIGLTISQGALSPTFASRTDAYAAAVEADVRSLTVTPTTSNAGASVTVSGVIVAGGTASGALDLGVGDTTITIVVTAEDGTAMGTYTVVVTRAEPPNTAPVIAPTHQTVMHAEHTLVTTVVATYALTTESMAESTDVEETIVWSLGGTDEALFTIDSATGGLTFKVSPDYESPGDDGAGNDYAVTVIATDDGSPSMSGDLAVTVTVTNVDESGTVAVTGTAQVGSTLAANPPEDPDGSVSSISWQWQRAPSGGVGAAIASATAATYIPIAADVNNTLQVVASYTDGHGSGKTATSAPTAMVVSATAPAAPGIALAADTGTVDDDDIIRDADDGITSNAQVDVTLDADATAWEYSTNSGVSYMTGSGTSFELPEGTYADNQVQVRQTVGGEQSAIASLDAVTVDTIAPTVASFDNITGVTANTQTTTTITFSEAVTGLDATDFGTSTDATVTAVSGGPTNYTVTYMPTMVPFTLTLAANSVMDTAGNTAPAAAASVQGTAEPLNQPPTANAGIDQTVAFSASVTLDGSASNDPDGKIATHAWEQSSGTVVTLSATAAMSPTFTAPDTAGALIFTLTVTDDAGATATATVTITVEALPNTRPVIATTHQPVMHAEHTLVTTVVATYALTTESMDTGETIVWSLGGTDEALFAIDSATGGLTFKVSPDYESPGDNGADNDYAVTVIATDNGSPSMSGDLAVTVTVTNVDESGTVTVTGTAQVGSPLTANPPEDADGSVSSISWQWQRAPSGGAYADIASGATAVNYTPVAADVDNTLQVVASYTDGHGSGKTATSAPTAMVVSATAPAAPGIALAADTGTADDDGITSNAQVDVTLDADATAWEYSTNSGVSYMTGSGTSFELPEGTYADNQVQVRQTVGGEQSAVASLSAVTVDSTAPTVARFEVLSGATAGMPTTTTITFSEAVTGLDATDFSASINAIVTAVSGGPTNYIVTYTPTVESFTLVLAANSVMDTAGNTAPAATAAAQGTAMAPPSSDATLSSLTLSAGTLSPAFTSGTLAYSVSVMNTVASITVTPTAADAGARVTVDRDTVTSGSASNVIDLGVSGITITIRVTAEDGSSTQSYTLTVSHAMPSEMETEVALGALGRSLVQGVSAVVQGRFHARPAKPFSQASLLDVLSLRPGTGSTLALEQLLRDVEFAYALGAAEDGDKGMGTALTVWGSGEWRQLSGDPEVGGNRLDYDGDSYSMHVGADVRIDGTLLGLSLGYNQGSLDYRGVSGTEKLEGDFVMLHPYVSRELVSGMMAWGTAGYGEGEVESESLGQKSDASLWSVAAGLGGRMELAGAGDVALSATAAVAQTEVDGSGSIPELRARVYWLRGEAQAGYRMQFGGGHARPFLLGAVRHDAGDAGKGTAIEVGGGLELQGAHGLDVELSGRVQVNSTENEEHGLGGALRYDRGRDGRGLRFSLSPALGATSQPSLDTSQPVGATSGASRGASLRGELGYGMGASGGLWHPFGRMQLQGDSQRWSTGLLLQWRPGVEFELEAERHHTGGSVGHGGLLNARLRF